MFLLCRILKHVPVRKMEVNTLKVLKCRRNFEPHGLKVCYEGLQALNNTSVKNIFYKKDNK